MVISTPLKSKCLYWRRAIAFCCLLILSLTSIQGNTDNFTDGVNAYKKGDYDTAAKKWLIAAEAGEPPSQFNLAILYELGQGVDLHWGIAAHWYRTSAEGGYSLASFALGSLYYKGNPSFPKNIDEALYWWIKAAEKGDVHAQTRLASALIEGEEIPRDILTAKRWLKQAAQKHHQEAIELLAQVEAEIATVITFDDKWVRRQNPELYTLEYYRGSTKSEAREFVIFSSLDNAAIYQSQYGDFTVLSGVYENPGSALVDISKLPDSVKQYKPRARIFSAIQAELQPIKKSLTTRVSQPTSNATFLSTVAEKNAPTSNAAVQESAEPKNEGLSNTQLGAYGRNWVVQQNSNYYTVQFVRSPTRSRAIEFINQYLISGAAIHHAQNGDNIVTAGVYKTRALAQNAINGLPNSLKRYGPFPQQFSVIHVVLNAPKFDSANKVLTQPITQGSGEVAGLASMGVSKLGEDGIPAESWILAQNSKSYTMQMVRLSTYKLAVQFVKRHKLKNPAIYRTAANNYDVIDGVYSGVGQVRSRIDKLPAVLKQHKPFPREFTKVKAALNPPTKPTRTSSEPRNVQNNANTKPIESSVGLVDWTLGRKPEEFTILLFSSSDIQRVKLFLEQYQVLNGIVYKMGESNFGAIAGVFSDEATANETISKLPEKIRFFKPKPISFGYLYSEAGLSEASATPPAAVPPGVPVSFEEFWGQQDPSQEIYTVLLYSSTNESDARNFVGQFNISGASFYKRKDNTFGVIGGKFPNEAAAIDAVDGLPQELRLFAPQPLSYRNVLLELAPKTIESESGVLGLNWILERSDAELSVLLYEGKSEAEAMGFVASYALTNAAIYPQLGGNSRVISGVFVDRKQAQEAIDGLPGLFSDLAVSILAFSDIKKSVVQFLALKESSSHSVDKDSLWIRQQDPVSYTIEMHSAKTPRDSIAFIKKYNLGNSVVYQTKKENYKTIIGVFDSRKSAKLWIKTFPLEQIKEYKPKLRKFSKVVRGLSDFDQKIDLN
ncbi:MAG: hypothetical protein GKR96_00920 [Gammaproteobacteria bacterium]|nr:hypothetical protein [Gammaproteobacteria bacterium]